MMSRFREQYRKLSDDELILVGEIKNKAVELEAILEKVKDGRYRSLAITSLEQAVMWAVKEVAS